MKNAIRKVRMRSRFFPNLLLVIALTAVYFIAGKMGLSLAFVHTNATAVWPPTGIALASFLIFGYRRVWPAILLGAFLVNITTTGSIVTSVGIAIGNTLEGLLGAYLVNRFAKGLRAFERPQDIFNFAFFAGMVSTAVSATWDVITLSLCGFAKWVDYGSIWLTWWLGDAAGALVFAPLLIVWITNPRIQWKWNQIFEIIFLFLLLFIMSNIAFGDLFFIGVENYPFTFLCAPILVWIAYRFSQRESITAVLMLSIIAIRGTLYGFGPFAMETWNTSLLLLQLFTGVTAVMVMAFAAIMAERRRDEEILRRVHEGLESTVQQQVIDLSKAVEALNAEIAERKHTEETLQELNKRTRSIIDTAYDAFISINENGCIVDWNRQAEISFGWSREEVIGRNLAETIIPSRYREAHARGLKHFLSTREGPILSKQIEMPALHRSGHESPVELTISPIQTKEGFVFNAFLHDITERKKIENVLRESEERFRLLVENVADYAIVMLDLKGHIVSWNAGAERIKGYRTEEIMGRHFSCFYPLEDIKNGKPDRILNEAISRGRVEDKGWRLRKDGRKFWADVVITALKNEANNLRGFVKITRDLTDYKRVEDQIEQQSRELIRSNMELEQFAYVASHDLKEPLRTISSFTQLLAKRYKGNIDKDADEFIRFITDGVGRMQKLIDDLLAFSRAGTKSVRAPIDCEKVLNEILADLQVLIKKNSAVITHDGLPKLKADAQDWRQLFQNLLSNAIKFHSKEPLRVHFSAKQRPNSDVKGKMEWVFSVKDNGIGIDPQFNERIFVIFQRLHSQLEYPGTGIGLAICKKIVERYGGHIWVESELGKGSTFYFAIPSKNVQLDKV